MRLIDADKLARSMYEEAMIKDSDMQKWDSGCWIRYKLFENVLDAQPTIEPERKKGEWIWQMYENIYRCSKCETETHVDECMEEPIYNYCPYCGARMDGES